MVYSGKIQMEKVSSINLNFIKLSLHKKFKLKTLTLKIIQTNIPFKKRCSQDQLCKTKKIFLVFQTINRDSKNLIKQEINQFILLASSQHFSMLSLQITTLIQKNQKRLIPHTRYLRML
jgi:hypothetical protein